MSGHTRIPSSLQPGLILREARIISGRGSMTKLDLCSATNTGVTIARTALTYRVVVVTCGWLSTRPLRNMCRVRYTLQMPLCATGLASHVHRAE
jgi:hypothetical protein